MQAEKVIGSGIEEKKNESPAAAPSPPPPPPQSPPSPPPPLPQSAPSPPPTSVCTNNAQMALPDGGQDDNRSFVHTLLAVNLTSLFTIIQVWTGNKFSFTSNDRILIYAVVFSTVAASSFCMVVQRLLRNPTGARKWVFKAAISFTGWDIIGCLCFFLSDVAKLIVMTVTSLLFTLVVFILWE